MAKSLLPKFRRRLRERAVSRRRNRIREAGRRGFDATRLILGVVTVAVLSVLMSIHFLPDRVSLTVGDRSPLEIRAPRSVSYVDREATLRRQEDAARSAQIVYETDRAALAKSARYAADVFDTIRRIRGDQYTPSPSPSDPRLKILSTELGTLLPLTDLRRLLSFPSSAIDRIQESTDRLVGDAMSRQIRDDPADLNFARRSFSSQVSREIGSATEAAIVSAIGSRALRPNQVENVRRTRQMREARIHEVKPVIGEIRAGEIVIHRGDVFTQLHQDKATALGLISPSLDAVTAIAIVGLASGMVIVVGLYAKRLTPEVYADTARLGLLALIVLSSVLGLKLFGQVLGLPLSLIQFGYVGMMMVVAAGMVVAVMLSPSLAVLVTGLLSVLTGLIMNHELRFTVMTLVSGLVGIYFVADLRSRRDLLVAAAAVAGTNLALVCLLGGLLGDTMSEVLSGAAWAVMAGGIGVAVFWFSVVALEKPFGILTHAWLLELSASEHPLLRELCVTAPGTYAHSVMVGNLAEAAAESIGANALFCRVASYYHDVGKMTRPDFFVENQHAENAHNRLNPSLSALIIASHVRDGLDLADQHRIPGQIKAIIAEHHGTSLIQYFYNQARENLSGAGESAKHDPVLEQHFRYEGPKPQTRESGIIMMADTVEAAVRCLERPTAPRIQSRIEELVHQKLQDGQLDESDLTFRDIQKVQAAFARIMTGMLHGRIDYKSLPKPSPGLAAQGLSVNLADNLAHGHADESPSHAVTHAGHYPELTEPRRPNPHAASGREESAPL